MRGNLTITSKQWQVAENFKKKKKKKETLLNHRSVWMNKQSRL